MPRGEPSGAFDADSGPALWTPPVLPSVGFCEMLRAFA